MTKREEGLLDFAETALTPHGIDILCHVVFKVKEFKKELTENLMETLINFMLFNLILEEDKLLLKSSPTLLKELFKPTGMKFIYKAQELEKNRQELEKNIQIINRRLEEWKRRDEIERLKQITDKTGHQLH